jgi:single-strand DNA-binding protein
MNRVILLGRLVKDPEVRYTNTNKVVAQFTLAVNRPFTNAEGQKEVDYINIVIWGKQAEAIGNYVSKGQRLLVEGRLQIRSYTGNDGAKHWVTEVVAYSFEFIEKKGAQTTTQQDQASPMESFGGAAPFDEEIPF